MEDFVGTNRHSGRTLSVDRPLFPALGINCIMNVLHLCNTFEPFMKYYGIVFFIESVTCILIKLFS